MKAHAEDRGRRARKMIRIHHSAKKNSKEIGAADRYMFLWKFTRGYVKIRMRCMRPEKMVNLLLAEGISLHNIERENKSTITAARRQATACRLLS